MLIIYVVCAFYYYYLFIYYFLLSRLPVFFPFFQRRRGPRSRSKLLSLVWKRAFLPRLFILVCLLFFLGEANARRFDEERLRHAAYSSPLTPKENLNARLNVVCQASKESLHRTTGRTSNHFFPASVCARDLRRSGSVTPDARGQQAGFRSTFSNHAVCVKSGGDEKRSQWCLCVTETFELSRKLHRFVRLSINILYIYTYTSISMNIKVVNCYADKPVQLFVLYNGIKLMWNNNQ